LNEPVSYRGPTANRGPASGEDGGTFGEYLETVGEVLTNKVYMLIILGYAAQTFVLGSVAYFGVRYLMENFHFTVGQAGSYFGGITVIVGVLGSLFGGWLCDYIRRGKNKAHATAVTMKLAFVLISVAFPLCLLSFVKNTAVWFFTVFVVAEFILFATASPINSAVIWSVPFRLSPLACSLSIMFIHILGDAISPAIIGALLDATKQNWTLTMTLNTLWLIWSVLFWAWAWQAAERKAKMIDDDASARHAGGWTE
jgi:sugar phosphate permease